jgi:hypothetical protein
MTLYLDLCRALVYNRMYMSFRLLVVLWLFLLQQPYQTDMELCRLVPS